jgi:hypothetical protein
MVAAPLIDGSGAGVPTSAQFMVPSLQKEVKSYIS